MSNIAKYKVPTLLDSVVCFMQQLHCNNIFFKQRSAEWPFQRSHISIHHCGKTVKAVRVKFVECERETQIYSVTLKLPLQLLHGVTVTRRKMHHSSECSLLCGMQKRHLLWCSKTIGEGTEVMCLIQKSSKHGLTRF
jgi:hypothetical protein